VHFYHIHGITFKNDNLQFSLNSRNLLTVTCIESHVSTVVKADVLPYLWHLLLVCHYGAHGQSVRDCWWENGC
jgi:hypothetical protein